MGIVMDLQTAIVSFLAQRRRRCKPNTLTAYEQRLDDWVRWRHAAGHNPQLADVTLAELRAYHDQLADRCKPNTVHNHYRSLRALWRWLRWETDDKGHPLLDESQQGFFENGRIDLPPVAVRERPAVTRAQVDALISVCGDDEEGLRNRAIVLLLWESGVRVFELAELTQHAVDLAEREARIIGKGDKEGAIWWGPGTAVALMRYLRVRRGPLQGPLFRGVSSRNNGGAMTPNAVRIMLKRLAKQAGVTLPKGAVVHGFRHGCARDLRRRGCTKEEVRDILRHKDLETTDRYLGLDLESPRNAHRRAHRTDRSKREEAS